MTDSNRYDTEGQGTPTAAYEKLNGLPIGRTVICDFTNKGLGNGDDVRVLGEVVDGQGIARWVISAECDVDPAEDAPGFWADAELTTAVFNPDVFVLARCRPLDAPKYDD